MQMPNIVEIISSLFAVSAGLFGFLMWREKRKLQQAHIVANKTRSDLARNEREFEQTLDMNSELFKEYIKANSRVLDILQNSIVELTRKVDLSCLQTSQTYSLMDVVRRELSGHNTMVNGSLHTLFGMLEGKTVVLREGKGDISQSWVMKKPSPDQSVDT